MLTLFAGLLVLSITPAAVSAGPNAQGAIEVLSDPYGAGNPTHYSVIRGTTKITFSHPLAGQFTRAEVTTRVNTGSKTTRFLLSRDGMTYQPTLQMDVPFEKHFSLKEDFACPNGETKPNYFSRAFAEKANDNEAISKTREMLIKANFFDESCFASNVSKEHRNAIMTAMADVMAKSTQNTEPEPKYLRCLEKYGFAHEAGAIEALVQQSVTDSKVNPKVRLACTTDRKAPAGVFDDKTRKLTLQTSALPSRDDYAATIFHELSHSAPLRDGPPLAVIEECCTMGEQCQVLKAYADKRKSGEKSITVAEAVDSKNSVATSSVTVLAGLDNEALAFGKKSEIVTSFENQSFTDAHKTPACEQIGKDACEKQILADCDRTQELLMCPAPKPSSKVGMTDSVFDLLGLPKAQAAVFCDQTGKDGALVAEAIKQTQARTVAELSEKYAPVGPITFDKPLDESVPVRMAISDDAQTAPLNATTKSRTPTRTIASISPLPDEKPERRMGSANNRNDVGGGRATFLVDTLEKAALKVTVTLTQEKLNQLAVNKDDIFKKDFKAKSASPHYIVTSSVAKPLQVADIGDIKGLGFANPFANAKNIAANAPAPASAKNAKALAKTLADEPTSASASSGPAATAPSNNSVIAQGSQAKITAPARSQKTPDRAPSSTKTNFKTMDHPALVKFLTASYRTVSGELENPDFISALANNGIQIIDHENRRIGATKPTATFIYRSDLSRLVQTRAHR